MAVEAPQGYSPEDLKLRNLIARYKVFALCAAASVALVLAMFLFAVFGAKGGAVSDSTSCSQWGSANQVRQADYAQLYVREHGPLSDGASSVAAVESAINSGCIIAYGSDEEDTISVLQSIRKEY